jgi:hypothetical protein
LSRTRHHGYRSCEALLTQRRGAVFEQQSTVQEERAYLSSQDSCRSTKCEKK